MSSPPIPPLYPNRPSEWGPYDPTREVERPSPAPPGESVATLRLQIEVQVPVSPSTATPSPWWRRMATLVIRAASYVAARYML